MIAIDRINAVVWRYMYLFRHSLDRLADAVYWPVLDLILWGLTTKWISESGASIPNVLLIMLTALVYWQIVWRANYEISVNLLEEFWNHNLVNLFATPLRVGEWIAGVMMVGVMKNVLTIGVGALAAWLLYSLSIFEVGFYFLPFLFNLMMFGWTIGFISASFIVYYGTRIQTLAWTFGFVAAPFSAVYYPLEVLPGWAQFIGHALPTSYIFEGMRAVINGGELSLRLLALSFVMNLLYLSLAISFFLFMFEKSREKGLGRLE